MVDSVCATINTMAEFLHSQPAAAAMLGDACVRTVNDQLKQTPDLSVDKAHTIISCIAASALPLPTKDALTNAVNRALCKCIVSFRIIGR